MVMFRRGDWLGFVERLCRGFVGEMIVGIGGSALLKRRMSRSPGHNCKRSKSRSRIAK